MNLTFPFILNHTCNTEEPSKFSSKLTWWEDNVVASYLICISIAAIILNSLVIYTFIRNRNFLTSSDNYILNLACSDVLLPLTGFVLPISSSFSHRWMYGEIGCCFYGFIGFFFGLVSIMTLTVMGVTRYTHICHPHLDIFSDMRTRRTVIFPYIYALVWSSIPFCGVGSYSVESYGTSCTLKWNENKVFITLVAVCCIAVPSAIMICTYGFILAKCHESSNNLRRYAGRRNLSPVSHKEVNLLKITFAMWWGFLGSWMPYAVVSLWSAYGDSTILPTRLTTAAVLLAKASTVVNPIIYFLLNEKFRPMLMRTLIKKQTLFQPKRIAQNTSEVLEKTCVSVM